MEIKRERTSPWAPEDLLEEVPSVYQRSTLKIGDIATSDFPGVYPRRCGFYGCPRFVLLTVKLPEAHHAWCSTECLVNYSASGVVKLSRARNKNDKICILNKVARNPGTRMSLLTRPTSSHLHEFVDLVPNPRHQDRHRGDAELDLQAGVPQNLTNNVQGQNELNVQGYVYMDHGKQRAAGNPPDRPPNDGRFVAMYPIDRHDGAGTSADQRFYNAHHGNIVGRVFEHPLPEQYPYRNALLNPRPGPGTGFN